MAPIIALKGDNSDRLRQLEEVLASKLGYKVLSGNTFTLDNPDTVLILDYSEVGAAYGHETEQARAYHPETMVLALYTFADREAENHIIHANIDDMLARPVSTERLRHCIRQLLAIQRLRHQLAHAHKERFFARHGLNALSLPLVDTSGEVVTLRAVEKQVIQHALSYYRGRISQVAKALGIGRSTLYRKIDELRLNLPHAQTLEAAPLSASDHLYTDHNSRANHTTRPMMRVSATSRS